MHSDAPWHSPRLSVHLTVCHPPSPIPCSHPCTAVHPITARLSVLPPALFHTPCCTESQPHPSICPSSVCSLSPFLRSCPVHPAAPWCIVPISVHPSGPFFHALQFTHRSILSPAPSSHPTRAPRAPRCSLRPPARPIPVPTLGSPDPLVVPVLPQVSPELYPAPEPDPVLPRVPPDLHPARARRGSPAEQLLHHQPDGSAAARPRQPRPPPRPGAGPRQRRHRAAPVVPQPRGQGGWRGGAGVPPKGGPERRCRR